jgi:hypothetical protein
MFYNDFDNPENNSIIDLEKYKEICKICDEILLSPDANEVTVAIPILHVIRDHPIFLNQYDSIFIKNIEKNKFNYIHLVKYFISLLLAFIKGKFIHNKYWVSSNKLKKSYDYIFVSHLLNEDQAGDNRDFYYDYLMIEYLSSGNPEETYSIPIQFREALLSWLSWRDIATMPSTRKGNLGDKRDRKQEFYNQRRIANAQFKPLYLMQAYEQNLDTQRMTVKA